MTLSHIDQTGAARMVDISEKSPTTRTAIAICEISMPLCHSIPISTVDVKITMDENIPGYQIQAIVKTKAETGVEMEALTAVTVAALTLYDMAKALEKTMVISNVRLVGKMGGKSGDFCAVGVDYLG